MSTPGAESRKIDFQTNVSEWEYGCVCGCVCVRWVGVWYRLSSSERYRRAPTLSLSPSLSLSLSLSLPLSLSGNCDASLSSRLLPPIPTLRLSLIGSPNPSFFPSLNPSLPRSPPPPDPKADKDLRAESLTPRAHTDTWENVYSF